METLGVDEIMEAEPLALGPTPLRKRLRELPRPLVPREVCETEEGHK